MHSDPSVLPFRLVRLILGLVFASTLPAWGQEPLHVRINQLLEAKQVGPRAAPIGDEEFARRIYLDLTGAVPSIAELNRFLADTSPGKRTALVDQLLQSPQHVRHFANTLDVMLMERRQDKHIKGEEWRTYLRDSIAKNKPWDQLAREILAADGTDEKIRPAAKFYLEREGEPNLLTRDIGRLFFGMDLACCQCHDHPLIDAYQQYDYYGLFAFVSRGTLFTDKDKKVFYAEQAEGDVKYTSVFTKQQDEVRPRVPGEFELTEPVYVRGEEYATAPSSGIRPVPHYSRRARLAELATRGSNLSFNRNMANRLWALMMGRGLVEPLDMHHVDNPSVYPELLQLLADELVRLKYDMRAFLRELAFSEIYQRSLRVPELTLELAQPIAAELKSLEEQHQQLHETYRQSAAAFEKAWSDYSASRKGVTDVLAEWNKANDAVGTALKKSQEAGKALSEAQQQAATKKDVTAAVQAAAAAAQTAATQLPAEAELKTAAEKFSTRAAQLAAELAAAEKLVQERTPPATSAAEALAAAKTATTPIQEKLTAAQQVLAAAEAPFATAQQQLWRDQAAAQITQVRLSAVKSLVECRDLLAAAQQARQQLDGTQQQITSGRQTLAELASKLPQLETAFAAAQSARDTTAKEQGETQSRLAAKQQALQLVADATAKADIAVQKLPKEADLKAAFEAIKLRRDQLTTEATELQKVATEREQTATAAAQQFASAQQALAGVRSQMDALQKMLPLLEAQLPTLQEQSANAQTLCDTGLERATTDWSKRFLVMPLEPLSPEQLGWSILKVTGVYDQYRAAGEAEVNKTMPLDPNLPADAAKTAERERLIDQYVDDKLRGNVATFVSLFGHAGGQPQRDFFATVDQALYFGNGGVLQSWLNPSGDNLMGRLVKLTDSQAVAEELYKSVLIRLPTAAELAAVADHLQGRDSDRQVALQELAWALITSTEFRFQ